MAITERTVIVANPANRSKKKMAMSLKQKLHFGSKKVRAAAKRAMQAKRSKARHAPRTKPNPTRKRAAARKQVKRRESKPRRSNPGEIIALTLGNPAKRSKKKAMAATKKNKKKASAPRSNPAGRRPKAKNNPGRRKPQRNPAGFGMNDMLQLGAGAVLGSSLPKLGSQMVLGAKNTGVMGYMANIAGTAILAWSAAKFLPRQRSLAAGILAGGIGQVIARAIGDYTQFGQYLNGAGMGDYMAANWVTPQRLPNALDSAFAENGYQAPQVVMASAAAGAGVGNLIGAPLY
jgi:hypothetical protein